MELLPQKISFPKRQRGLPEDTHSTLGKVCENGSQDCEKGKLAKILDEESMDFSSDSEKKNLTE